MHSYPINALFSLLHSSFLTIHSTIWLFTVDTVVTVVCMVVICNRHTNKNAWAMVQEGMFLLLLLFSLTNLHSSRCRLGVNIQEEQINRNPYTGATSVVTENEFVPTGGYGFGYGGGYGGSYGYNRFI